jgi:hypothetical protein
VSGAGIHHGEIVRATLGGEPFDRAMQRELGWSTADLEKAFTAWVNRR